MPVSLLDLLTAINVSAGMPLEAARSASAAACDALRLPAGAFLPLVETGGAQSACDTAECDVERYVALHAEGLRFSERAARSQYDGSRYCRWACGGCGAEHDSKTPLHYQIAGPEFKIEKGQYAGKVYIATLSAACLAHLESARLESENA